MLSCVPDLGMRMPQTQELGWQGGAQIMAAARRKPQVTHSRLGYFDSFLVGAHEAVQVNPQRQGVRSNKHAVPGQNTRVAAACVRASGRVPVPP